MGEGRREDEEDRGEREMGGRVRRVRCREGRE